MCQKYLSATWQTLQHSYFHITFDFISGLQIFQKYLHMFIILYKFIDIMKPWGFL